MSDTINQPVTFRQRLTRSRWRGLGLLSFISLVLIGGFTFRAQLGFRSGLANLTNPTTAQASTAPPITMVARGQIRKNLLLDGELRAVNSRIIFAMSSDETKITYLPPEGTIVKPGDRLVELDSSAIVNKIKEDEEKIVAAENEIIKTRSTHESALREMQVQLSQLWLNYEKARIEASIPEGLEGRRQYQDKQFELSKTKAEYDSQLSKIEKKKKEQVAELQIKIIEKAKAEAQLNQDKSKLDRMNIRAPAEGMVIYSDHWFERRKIQVGDVVWGGAPVVRLPDLKEMEVLARVNEVDGPRLIVGQKTKVLLDSYPQVAITGTVNEISQTAIKASWMAKAKIFNVIIALDQTVTEIMKPGMSAQVAVTVSEAGPHLLVPRSAVNFTGEGPQVIRVEGEQRRPVTVTITAADPLHYAVADNGALKENDGILTHGEK